MSEPKVPEEVLEQAEVLHTGRWYIAELDEPQLAVQGESECDALQKLIKRWEEYTSDDESYDVRISKGDSEHPIDPSEISDIDL